MGANQRYSEGIWGDDQEETNKDQRYRIFQVCPACISPVALLGGRLGFSFLNENRVDNNHYHQQERPFPYAPYPNNKQP